MSDRKTICIVVSDVKTAEAFLLGHMTAMKSVYDVVLVADCPDKDHLRRRGVGIDVVYVPLVRKVSPIKDLACLFSLFLVFRRRKFDAVHSVTPKAGLLAMLSARLAHVPARIHTFTGQVWATSSGPGRVLLKGLDRLLAVCATHILVDSPSQLEFLRRQRVISTKKGSVLANGSISGVDMTRFHPQPRVQEEVRASLGIPTVGTVFAYIGRLRRDKGVLDLAAAFSQVCGTGEQVYLVLVGPDEEGMRPQIEARCASCLDRLRFVDWTPNPERYMASADLLCLPSYREGFGSVSIEAAACEVPSLASRIYGLTDAVIDELTGILHEPGNVQELARGMQRAVRDPAWRIAMGRAARARVEREFAKETVTAALLEYYAKIFGSTVQGSGGVCDHACGHPVF